MMNRKQRKLHLSLWVVLAVLLPIGFVAAMVVIPEKSLQENVFLPQKFKYEKLVAKQSDEHMILLLRSNEAKNKFQLEVIVTRPFINPEIGIYLSEDGSLDHSYNIFLGNLKDSKNTIFDLPDTILSQANWQIVFYDPIHKQRLSNLKFEL